MTVPSYFDCFIGIDPGKKGGIAVINDSGVYVYPYSNDKLIEICDAYANADVICTVEQVHAMPGQGVTSMFNFGKSLGYILGVLEANDIPYQEVPPQKWKKEYSLNSDKQASIECCQKLFPKVNLLATERSKKPHDGICEALLICEYGRRHFA